MSSPDVSELIEQIAPEAMRGKDFGAGATQASCGAIETHEYENVRISRGLALCEPKEKAETGVSISFKRDICPKSDSSFHFASEQLGAVPDVNMGGGLLLDCTDTPNSAFPPHAYCAGFVEGVAGTLTLLQKIEMPGDVTKGQKMAVVVKYLQEHHELLQQPSVVLVNNALVEAWPAKKAQSK